VKLYRSSAHLHHWIAYSDSEGWTVFPARFNGWEERRPADSLHPDQLFEVPLWLSFNTGLIESLEARRRKQAA
jgi:hypothetical protein